MTYRIHFRQRARRDVAQAYEWYEERREQLGELLLFELHRSLDYILQFPNGFPRVSGPYRQARVEGFPYVVVYRLDGPTVVVMRVFHTSRDPKKKFKKPQ
jgi:plasmid stabilization system protein ParE